MKAELIILAGPTAIGKTKLSVELAKKIDAEIISCDSMQIYKYMDIGSAKVKEEEMEGIKHHLINFVYPKDSYSVAEYKLDCMKAIDEIHKKGKRIIITGGTGLYIDSVIKNLSFTQSCKDEKLRNELESIYKEKGKEELVSILMSLDPVSAFNIHPNNVKRVIRAIEVSKVSGQPFSEFKQKDELNPDFNIHYYYLNMEREKLYERINERVKSMFKEGLVSEVKTLKEMGLDVNFQSMQGIGYKEVFPYLSGKCNLEETMDKIAQNSRNYAKRQLTWFRNEQYATELDKNKMSDKEIIDFVCENL